MIWMIINGLIAGLLLGFVMQRTRFCLTGGFRDMYVQKDNKMFYTLLVAIAVQSIGLLVLTGFDMLTISYQTSPVIGTTIGSFVLGIGIVLAGGCAADTWYRTGEGLIGSWVALIMYALSATITKTGILLPLMNKTNKPVNVSASMSQTTGISSWILVIILTGVALFLVIRTLHKPKSKTVVPKLKQRYSGIRHYLFEKRYHPFIVGIIVGLIALSVWPMSYSIGREDGLGIATLSAHIIQFLMSGDLKFINWGVFLVLGIFIGSYTAARGAKEFKWRLPDKITIRNSAIDDICMEFGASVADGCSIGNGLVATATLSWQGWTALVSVVLGTWFMSYFIFVRPMKQVQKQTAQSTQISKQTQTT